MDKENEKKEEGCSFKMDKVEYEKYKAFCKKHRNCQRKPDGRPRFGTIGGGFSVTFIPTGLSPIISVKCNHCGEIEDITDSDNW